EGIEQSLSADAVDSVIDAKHGGKRRKPIEAGAVIDIDIVDPDRRVPDADFAGGRRRQRFVYGGQCRRVALLTDNDLGRC
ncbi:MAG: hypothetical protein J0I36_13180, partial [Pandoraea sp.]|nr:hypothetical protein [Pandoraea sp.]